MNDHNSFRGTGWISRDPELRVSQKGTPWVVLNVDIASGDGESRRHCWIDVKVFGEPARRFEHTKKGARVSILGRLELETWEDKQTGGKRSKHVVVADSCHEIAEAKEDQPVRTPKKAPAGKLPMGKTDPAPAVDYGDIPF